MQKKINVLMESESPQDGVFINGVRAYARFCPDWILYYTKHALFSPFPESLASWNGDGFIYCATNRPRNAEKLEQLQKNVKTVEVFLTASNSAIGYSFKAAFAQLTDFLLEKGIHNITFFSDVDVPFIKEQKKYVSEYVNKAGGNYVSSLNIPLEHFVQPPHWDSADDQRLMVWLKKIPKPVGILLMYEPWGQNLINACRLLHLHIPGDVALIGLRNNAEFCESLTPTLSACDMGMFQAGYEAARLLDLKMKGERLPKLPIVIKPVGLVERESTERFSDDNYPIMEAITIIRENAILGSGINDVLQTLNMSRRTLERGVKKALGRTPWQELNRVRMEHVVRLLERTEMKLSDIAQQSGFTSPHSLNMVFKSVYGKTPLEYRRDFKK